MSWRNIPKKENYMPLFAEDWNSVIDALDDLYYQLRDWENNGFPFDIIPKLDLYYSLGSPNRRWLYLWVKYLYTDPLFTDDLIANTGTIGKLYIKELLEANKGVFDQLYIGGKSIQELIEEGSLSKEVKVFLSEEILKETTSTKTKIVKITQPSNAKEIFKVPKGTKIIVKGWHLITNSKKGEIKLLPIKTLIPIGWMPVSIIKVLEAKGMEFELEENDAIWIYWENMTPKSKLFILLNLYEAKKNK